MFVRSGKHKNQNSSFIGRFISYSLKLYMYRELYIYIYIEAYICMYMSITRNFYGLQLNFM